MGPRGGQRHSQCLPGPHPGHCTFGLRDPEGPGVGMNRERSLRDWELPAPPASCPVRPPARSGCPVLPGFHKVGRAPLEPWLEQPGRVEQRLPHPLLAE